MHTEIFIEGRQADVTDEIQALFTYAINDIRDFSTRNTAFSKTINLPGSSRNNQLFGHAFQFSGYTPGNTAAPNIGSNFNAGRAAKCVVLQDGIQVFKGILRLLEMVMNGSSLVYECAVAGELGGLVENLGTKLLTDLDFSAYDQDWTAANISATWSTAGAGSGLYYPLIDYGNVSDANKVDFLYTTFRPALYAKEYLDKVFAGSGYTYESTFLNTSLFKRMVIPHNEDKLYKLTAMLVNVTLHTSISYFLQTGYTGGSAIVTNTVAFPTGPILGRLSNFTENVGHSEFTYTGGSATGGYLNYAFSGLYYGGHNQVTVHFKVQVNGVTIKQHDLRLDGTITTDGRPFSFSSGINQFFINIAAGQVIRIYADVTGTGGGASFNVEPNAGFITLEVTTQQAAPAFYSNAIQINNCIPKQILQKDLLVSIVKMFNLYIIEDTDKPRHLHIIPYPDFYDFTQPDNWTAKVDRSREIRLKPMSEVNSRYYNFLFEKDSDWYNNDYRNRYAIGYGDFIFDAGSSQGLDFVKDKSDLKLIFAASPIAKPDPADKYATAIMAKDDNGVESGVASKIRILQAKYFTGRASWNIMQDAISSAGVYSTYGYAGHFNDPATPTADINFGATKQLYYKLTVAPTGANLFNAYYSAYMAEICDKDSKLLTCYLDLKALDIAQLSFQKPKLIDGVLWRLNKVIDFATASNKTTKCELLKVIELSY